MWHGGELHCIKQNLNVNFAWLVDVWQRYLRFVFWLLAEEFLMSTLCLVHHWGVGWAYHCWCWRASFGNLPERSGGRACMRSHQGLRPCGILPGDCVRGIWQDVSLQISKQTQPSFPEGCSFARGFARRHWQCKLFFFKSTVRLSKSIFHKLELSLTFKLGSH